MNKCPYCLTKISGYDKTLRCPSCGTTQHHLECWTVHAGCSVYGCTGTHERYQELDQGRISLLIAAFKPHRKYPEVKRCIHYLKQNKHRMRYDEFRQQAICASSGVVEAGCKVAIGTRLKRAGMHWTLHGSNAIIALRCCKLSGTFEDFWEWRSTRPNAA